MVESSYGSSVPQTAPWREFITVETSYSLMRRLQAALKVWMSCLREWRFRRGLKMGPRLRTLGLSNAKMVVGFVVWALLATGKGCDRFV
jgi:hypothetical protein